MAKLLLHRGKRRLGQSGSGWSGQIPSLDLHAAPAPFIRKAVNDRAGQAAAETGFDLPGQDFALRGLAFAQAVDADFAQHQRLGVGNHLQAGQVILKGPPVVEVNVEAEKIDVARREKFSRRIIGEGAKALGIDRLWPRRPVRQ